MKIRVRNPDRELEVRGARKVRDVLAELSIDPDTVLVIRDRTLVTGEERLEDSDSVEIRPVISGGGGAKCRRCRRPAVITLRRHNTAFCESCFLEHFRRQVERSIRSFRMIQPTDRVLVAVSGGKDSLALWDVLLDVGHDATGLYLGLGIGEYSDASGRKIRAFAQARGAPLIEVDLREEHGYDVPTAGRDEKVSREISEEVLPAEVYGDAPPGPA